MNASHYYKILGISENADIGEIKNAFRQKAKAFHPDINKTEGAHEKFLDINEAYTYLMDFHGSSAGSGSQSIQDEYNLQWMARERQKTREHAAQRARMRFEEFQRSSVYKTTSLLSHMLDYFLLVLGIFIIIAAGFGLYIQGLYFEDNGEKILNINGIIADLLITIIGILFISLSWSNIKAYREKLKKKQGHARES
jgi:curved DNA-binding protein CbpA